MNQVDDMLIPRSNRDLFHKLLSAPERVSPGGVTGQYPGRDVRLENRRIFRVSSETHFPLSVFVGETGFGLLSARRDQRRRRHGRKDPISKNLRLFVKNHSCIATSRPLPGSQQLPLVLQTTPLAPQVPPGSTPIDGGGILLFLDFHHFRPLAPHT